MEVVVIVVVVAVVVLVRLVDRSIEKNENEMTKITTTGTCTSDRDVPEIKGFSGRSAGRPAERDGGHPDGCSAGRTPGRSSGRTIRVVSDADKKAFDRGGLVWLPRSTVTDDRLPKILEIFRKVFRKIFECCHRDGDR